MKMAWCIAEAARDADRAFLRNAYTMSLMQDGRKSRLLVRFKGCDASLRTRQGILGQAKLGNMQAHDIREATLKCLTTFCTRRHGAPARNAAAPPAMLDERLLARLTQIIECFTADAASDEQLAGEMLRNINAVPLRDNYPLLSNIIVVTRDRAHAARRITKRPWQADPELNEVMRTMITSKTSITSLIQNSGVFQHWFHQNVQRVSYAVTDNKRVKDLSMAKHRFDSTSKPASRLVLLHEAVLMTAQQIVDARRWKAEARSAQRFLEYVTAERLLQLAMIADAADEAMCHVRALDRENIDNAELPQLNHDFLVRVAFLFGPQEGCFRSGHTEFMEARLRKEVIVFLNGAPISIGGPGSITATVRRCSFVFCFAF